MAKSSKSGVVVLETFDAHVKHSLLNHDDLKASDELFLIQLPNSVCSWGWVIWRFGGA
eukprot:m.55931 g.55931  ORF g.55931 m.55931 type:complete len:58 (+) comp7778_c1_seq1:22-195(+)